MSKKPIARLSKGSLCVALALAGSSLALGQSAPAFAASGEKLSGAALVQRVADEQEIHNLLIRYGQMLDTRDFVGYVSLFAKNGEWSGLLNGKWVTVKGQKAIEDMMKGAFAGRPYDPANMESFHLLTNFLIEVDGDRATAFSRWTVMYKGEDKNPYPRLGGHYDDVLVRENGTWKFLSRAAPRDIPPMNAQ